MAFNINALRGRGQKSESGNNTETAENLNTEAGFKIDGSSPEITGAGLLNNASKQMNVKDNFDIHWIKLSQIEPNDKNKYHIDDKDIQDMISSIRIFGLLQNLEVKKINDCRYVLITGEKRYRALTYLNEQGEWPDQVPCLVKNFEKIVLPLTEEEKEILSIGETNTTQRDYDEGDRLHEIEELNKIYTKLRKLNVDAFNGRIIKGEKNRDIISKQLGMSSGTISKYDRVSKKGSNLLRTKIEKNEVSINVADQIAALPEEEQNNLIEKVEASGKHIIEQHDLDKYIAVKKENTEVPKKSKKPKYTFSGEHKYQLGGEYRVDNPGEFTITKSELMEDLKDIMKSLQENGVILDEKRYLRYKKNVETLRKMFK